MWPAAGIAARVPGVLLAIALAVALSAVPRAEAAGRLRALDVELDAPTVQFSVHPWQGRSAVSAFTLRALPDGRAELAVHRIVLDAAGWHEVGRWPLPADTRYVEPLRLPGQESGWLLLVRTQWQIAVAQGDTLVRHPLCTCDTIYSHGGVPDATENHFVYDLDGDGVDEVVLPYSSHLEAYRITLPLLAPEPLWRVRWHPDDTPLPRADKPEYGFQLPTFTLADATGTGQLDLLVVERDRLLVAPLPAPGPVDYGLDAPRRALLERRSAETPLPESLIVALHRVGERRFATAAAFLGALAQGMPAAETEAWAPHLLRVMALARSQELVLRPYAVPLGGLGAFRPQDRGRVLGHLDMDGDGVLDLLHAKLLDYGSALNQKNELRWYRGRVENGRLAFDPPTDALHSDAGSFAEVVRPRRDDKPPLSLLMATTEVSLGSIMQALATQSVTLQARILPFQPGALGSQAVAANQFTYRELKATGRRAMFLLADLNGDGWRDYVLNLRRGELSVFLSAGGPPGLARPDLVQTGLPLPSRPERVLIADLAGDGREELVLRFDDSPVAELATKLRLIRYEDAPAAQ